MHTLHTEHLENDVRKFKQLLPLQKWEREAAGVHVAVLLQAHLDKKVILSVHGRAPAHTAAAESPRRSRAGDCSWT